MRRYGRSVFRMPATWVTAGAILIPVLLWYAHADRLAHEYGNTFGIAGAGYSKFGTLALFTSPNFYVSAVRRIFLYHLTPVAAVAFACGLWVALRSRQQGFLLYWLGSVVLYVFVAAKGVHGGHYHYLLPLQPVACILIGLGAAEAWRVLSTLPHLRAHALLQPALAVLVLMLFATNAAWASDRFVHRDRYIDDTMWAKKKETGRLVRNLTESGSLIIVVDTQMDGRTPEQSMCPPDVFYFGDRKGWYVSLSWLTEERIRELKHEGARYLVVSGQSVEDFKLREPLIERELHTTSKVLLDEPGGIIFDLTREPAAPPIAARPDGLEVARRP
jgi:hypothetical protein